MPTHMWGCHSVVWAGFAAGGGDGWAGTAPAGAAWTGAASAGTACIGTACGVPAGTDPAGTPLGTAPSSAGPAGRAVGPVAARGTGSEPGRGIVDMPFFYRAPER